MGGMITCLPGSCGVLSDWQAKNPPAATAKIVSPNRVFPRMCNQVSCISALEISYFKSEHLFAKRRQILSAKAALGEKVDSSNKQMLFSKKSPGQVIGKLCGQREVIHAVCFVFGAQVYTVECT